MAKEIEKLFPTIDLKSLLEKGVPKIEWKIKDLVPARGVSIFGGTAGAYKTWIGMLAALCCASGKKFLNHFETTKCKVFYIDEENGDVTIPNRFQMLINGMKFEHDFENLELSIFNGIKFDSNIDELLKVIGQVNPELIIIDSLVRCMNGEEDKATDVRKIFENVKKIMETNPNTAFIILHHTTKGGKKNMDALRGSGDIAAFADIVLMFSGTMEGFVNVRVVKNRHIDLRRLSAFSIDIASEEEKNITFSYTPDKSGQMQTVTLCIEDLYAWFDNENIEGFFSKDAAKAMEKLGHKKNTVYSALSELKQKGDITKIRRGQYKVKNGENEGLRAYTQ